MKIAKILLGLALALFSALMITSVVQTANPGASEFNLTCIGVSVFLGSVALMFGQKKEAGILAIACGLISENIGADCVAPPSPGTKETLRLYNFDEVTGLTTAVDTITITAIVMASGKLGFAHIGQNASLEPKYNTVAKKYVTQWNHELKYRLFYWDAVTKLQIEQMLRGKFIAVVENNEKGAAGEMSYELYGGGSGLFCTDISREPNSSDEAGAFVVTLKSKEGLEEGRPPRPVFITSYAATTTMIDATITT
jgi:hypothetical protein